MPLNDGIEIPKSVITYYKLRYSKVDRWNDDYYYDFVVKLFGNISGKKVLDVGFGFGELLKKILDNGGTAYGIEIAEGAYNFVKEAVPKAVVKLAPAEKIPFGDDFFDIVICNGTLEHFIDMAAGLAEIRRVLKKEGFLIIIVPNRNWVLNKLYKWSGIHYAVRLLFNVLPDQPIEREFNLSGWLTLIQANNFSVSEWQPWNKVENIPFISFISIGPQYIKPALCSHFIIKCKSV